MFLYQRNNNSLDTVSANLVFIDNTNHSEYKNLLDILAKMKYNSEVTLSLWTPYSDFPNNEEGFWLIKIYKGEFVGYNYFDAVQHNMNNSIMCRWLGTYGDSTGKLVWKQLIN